MELLACVVPLVVRVVVGEVVTIRRGHQEDAARPQHPVDLANKLGVPFHVFEDLDSHDAIEGAIGQRRPGHVIIKDRLDVAPSGIRCLNDLPVDPQ